MRPPKYIIRLTRGYVPYELNRITVDENGQERFQENIATFSSFDAALKLMLDLTDRPIILAYSTETADTK